MSDSVKKLNVSRASCKVSNEKDCSIYTDKICSGIAVVAWSQSKQCGGILYSLLPTSENRASNHDFNPYMFVDTGLISFFESLVSFNEELSSFRINIIGGADVIDETNTFIIGKNNFKKCRSILTTYNFSSIIETMQIVETPQVTLNLGDGVITLNTPLKEHSL